MKYTQEHIDNLRNEIERLNNLQSEQQKRITQLELQIDEHTPIKYSFEAGYQEVSPQTFKPCWLVMQEKYSSHTGKYSTSIIARFDTEQEARNFKVHIKQKQPVEYYKPPQLNYAQHRSPLGQGITGGIGNAFR